MAVAIQFVIEIFRQIPAIVIGTFLGSIVSLSGVMLSLRSSRNLQSKQLAHDATQRCIEREMSLRKEVFLQSAESVSRLSSMLGQMADLSITDKELSQIHQREMAQLAKVNVIASEGTIKALNEFWAYSHLTTYSSVWTVGS